MRYPLAIVPVFNSKKGIFPANASAASIAAFVYSFEEGFNSSSQTYSGVGIYNYSYILRDKKADGELITVTYVSEIGKPELIKIPIEKIKNYLF